MFKRDVQLLAVYNSSRLRCRAISGGGLSILLILCWTSIVRIYGAVQPVWRSQMDHHLHPDGHLHHGPGHRLPRRLLRPRNAHHR